MNNNEYSTTTPDFNSVSGTALDLASLHGIRVFPCGENKAPLTPNGFKDASTDPEQIRSWWTQWPDALVGVPTGSATGIDALDIDPRHGGNVWYQEHAKELPDTRTHQTRGGGLHILFKSHPGLRNSAGRIADGVDVRAEGGYVIWWPALHEHRICDWPEWLIQKQEKRHETEAESSASQQASSLLDVAAALAAIPNCAAHHNRSFDDWNRVALAVHAATDGSDAGYQLFLDWSRSHPTFSKDETKKRWDQMTGCPPEQIGAGTLFHLAKEASPGWEIPSRQRPDPRDEFTAEPAPEGTGKPDLFTDGMPDFDKMAQKPALAIEYASDFFVEAGLPLVDGWIDQGELVAMVGAPGSWKTTLAADLAGCIAWERPWMGCKVTGGSVLVVELEGARGFRNRVIAWHKHHGLEYRAAPIGMVSQGITLTEGATGEDTQRVIAAAKAIGEKTDLPLRLIMVDTMSRVIGPGRDEDKASDISSLVQAVNEIQRQTSAAVLLIHHVGFGDSTRGRGSSNQRASWDVDLLVQAEGMFGTVSAPKQREKEKLPPIPFATVVVEIGTRQDGKAITSCVTRPAEEGEIPESKVKAKGPKLGKNELLLVLALTEQQSKWQPLPKGTAFPPNGLGMPEDELREAFERKLSSDMSAPGKRGTWGRAVKCSAIGMDSGWVWLADQPGAGFYA